nr:hypothetical protein [Tanacetum cinerariifolium]
MWKMNSRIERFLNYTCEIWYIACNDEIRTPNVLFVAGEGGEGSGRRGIMVELGWNGGSWGGCGNMHMRAIRIIFIVHMQQWIILKNHSVVLDNLPHDLIDSENQVSPWHEVWVEKQQDGAMKCNQAELLDEIELWIPVSIINNEHDDKPEGEDDFDYGGQAVTWGLTRHKQSAYECCQACLDHARNAKPNALNVIYGFIVLMRKDVIPGIYMSIKFRNTG